MDNSGTRRSLFILAGLITLYWTLTAGGCPPGFILLATLLIVSAEIIFGFVRSGIVFPYTLMLASPATLLFYSTIPDFTARIFSLILMIYVFSVPLLTDKGRSADSNWFRKPAVVWSVPLILFIFLSVWLDHKGFQLSGDEPHYLMVTQSLVEDRDLSLKNNVEEKTYLDFIPVEVSPHMIIREGKHLSFHMPGLSFLLIPFYLIFKLSGGLVSPHLFFRLSISVINSFFPLVLFYLMRQFFPGKKIAGIWLLSVLTVPFLFHSVHIFPELPAATLTAASFLFLFADRSRPGLSGFLYSLSIWFHVKYYPLLMLFAVLVVVNLYRENRKSDLFRFLIFPFVSAAALLLFSKAVYGTFNPAGIFPAESYWAAPFLLKLKVFFAYFIDQRDGLLLYAPALLLFPFGLRIREFRWKAAVLLTLIYTVFHAVTTVRGAHAPAGRPLIFVLWIILLFLCNHYFKSGKTYVFSVLTGLNVYILVNILQYPAFVYQPVFAGTSDGGSSLLRYLGSSTVDLTAFFPSFLTKQAGIHIPNLVWISALIIGTIVFYKKKFRNTAPAPARTIKYLSTLLFILSVLLLSLFPRVHISPKDRVRVDGVSLFNTSSNFVWLDGEKKFRIKSNEAYTVYFEERQWKKKIKLKFDYPENHSVEVWNGRERIFRSASREDTGFEIDLPAMKKIRIKGVRLVPVRIRVGSPVENDFFHLMIEGK